MKPLFTIKNTSQLSTLLVDRFLVPPFSVFDTKQGYWQNRKNSWISLGIKSELGRGNKLLYGDGFNQNFTFLKSKRMERTKEVEAGSAQQTSIFDPVLCEITYKWFTVQDAVILDPFAGGSVRGVVAGCLGKTYYGIDLSGPQVNANKEQYEQLFSKYKGIVKPKWIVGDSKNVTDLVKVPVDCIFSCPPYYNLEVYSTDSADLSNKPTYAEFLADYEYIIDRCCSLLKDNSFAIFVVGNVRDSKTGGYYDLVGDTIKAFQKCGLLFYNDCIIVNVHGTLPIRAPLAFNGNRKVGKHHQNYLVFYKGDQKNIKEKFGYFDEMEDLYT